MKFSIRTYSLLLTLLIGISTYSQSIEVNGTIYNSKEEPIVGASIVLYKGESIEDYTFSNENGLYRLNSKSIKVGDTIRLVVSSLGYSKFVKTIVSKAGGIVAQDFVLKEKIEQLNEVVLEANEKIKIDTDTITFNADSYSNASQQVVEDLLKELPGVEVLNDGNIKVNGKPIDKLLVEGDDLFDKKYKLLSKNLDAKNISEVQILNNFEDNPVLKSFQESEKVAINLKLKEDKKNIWFGNISLGLGNDERYEGTANLGLLKKKIKLFNLTSTNSIRNLSTSQVQNGIQADISVARTETKIEKENNTFVDIDNVSNPDFSNNEDLFNNSFLNSFALVTNLSGSTKLRNLSYYAFDKIDKQNTNLVQFFTSPGEVGYSEERSLSIRDIFFATELEIKHFSKDGTYYKFDFSFENNPSRQRGNILTNIDQVYQLQDDNKHDFFNHLNITKKLKENTLLSAYAYYGVNRTEQFLQVESNVIDQGVDNEDMPTSTGQNINSPLEYTGLIAEIITKHDHSELGFEFAANFDNDKINSSATTGNQSAVDSLTNGTSYRNFSFGSTVKYTYAFSNALKLKSSVNISQNYIDLNDYDSQEIFFNPSIGLKYKSDRTGSFGLNYSFTNNLPPIQYLNENFILRNYRTFTRGLNSIDPIRNQNINFRYSYQNYKNLFLVNSSVSYGFSNINYGFESFVDEAASFNTYRILEGGDILNFNLGANKYLNILPISVRLSTSQSWSNNFVDINNNIGRVRNYNANYRFQGTTYLNIPLNFKFYLQYNDSRGMFNQQQTSNNYLEASLNSILELSETLVFKIKNNYYSINGNNFLFSNLEVDFNPKKSRWSYRLIGSNLSNVNEFSNVFISEFQSSESSFKIVPRYLLLSTKYRF